MHVDGTHCSDRRQVSARSGSAFALPEDVAETSAQLSYCTVIHMAVARIDYWEPPGSRIARLAQAVKALLTRRAVETPMKTLDGFTD